MTPRFLHAKRRGAAVVEFAMVAPVFFLFLFGIIEFSRILMVHELLTNAAREGCRLATLGSTVAASTAETRVRTYMASGIPASVANDAAKMVVTVTPALAATTAPGTNITVTVSLRYGDVSWVNFLKLGNTQLRASATMPRE